VLIGDFNCVDDIQEKSQNKSHPRPSQIVKIALKEMIAGTLQTSGKS
jgi:hypothetical protein